MFEELKSQYKYGGVVTQIIYWNVMLFLSPLVVQGVLGLFQVEFIFIDWVSLSSNPQHLLTKPWSILSYGFFHGGFIHLIFNMISLYYLGLLFQTFFNQKQFLAVYILGVLFSGVIYLFSYMVFPALLTQEVPMVGASGAIMAILWSTAGYAPQMQIRLPLIGSVRLWQIAMVFVVLDLIQLPYQNTGGHIAHLGGALFGYLYSIQLKKGDDWSVPFHSVLDRFDSVYKPKKKSPFVKVHRNESTSQSTQTNRPSKTKNQQQIDDILDKISKSGYDSLSKEEKDFLFRAGK